MTQVTMLPLWGVKCVGCKIVGRAGSTSRSILCPRVEVNILEMVPLLKRREAHIWEGLGNSMGLE